MSELAVRPTRLAVAFSGGLDSTLLTLLAAQARRKAGLTPPRLYVTGLEGAHDLQAARSAEVLLGQQNLPDPDRDSVDSGTKAVLDLELEVLEVLEPEARESLDELLELIGPDPMTLAFLLPLHIVASRATEPAILSGQGADELFGGYARYRSMSPRVLERALETDLTNLVEGGLERDRSVARAADKELLTPYLDPRVVISARAFTAHQRFHGLGGRCGEAGKGLLRELGLELGLPPNLAGRSKKAAQYGSGFQKVTEAHFEPLHTASLELDYATPAIARAVELATAPDNLPYVSVLRDGATLKVSAAAKTIGSLEQTLDDLLACADTAAKIARKAD